MVRCWRGEVTGGAGGEMWLTCVSICTCSIAPLAWDRVWGCSAAAVPETPWLRPPPPSASSPPIPLGRLPLPSPRLRLSAAPPTCVPTLRLPSGLTFWVACCVYSCSPDRSRSKKIKIKTSFSVVWDANQLTSLGFPSSYLIWLIKIENKKKIPSKYASLHPFLWTHFIQLLS